MRLRDTARRVAEFFQDRWFDYTRRVRTSRDVSLHAAGIPLHERFDSEHYVPARPAHIREAFRTIPVPDLSEYTFIDLGCGKGRTLFIAAEFGFREIVGVELSETLHHQASRNVRSFRGHPTACIRAVHQNAKDFAFPEAPLVLYLFNPFGQATMRTVLRNLEDSLLRVPRPAVVILLWPRHGGLLLEMADMSLCHDSQYIEIFSNQKC